MVTYKQLRDARPEEFEQAGQQFSKWADQVDQHATDVRKRIIDPVFSGNVWDDKAADVARDYMEGLTRGMGMSFDDMEATGKALKTFGTDLAEAQFEAKRNVERADDAGLDIDPETGLASVPSLSKAEVEDLGGEEAAQAYQNERSQIARQCNRAVYGTVERATQADNRAAASLRQLGQPIPTLQELNQRADRMEERATEAAELAAMGRMASDEQLDRLRDLLTRYSDDPAFATTFLNEMGAEGTLWLAGQMAAGASDYMPEERLEMLKQIQAELGDVLATGTDTDNQQRVADGWVDSLLYQADQKIDIGLATYQPYGHQLLGVLLHQGDYSEEFLNKVGDDLVEFERDHGGSSVWALNMPQGAMYDGFRLNLVDDQGAGFDPMTGLMDSMSRNENAAEQFFDPNSHPGRIDYLLTDRHWLHDTMEMIEPGQEPAGLNALGNALDAAATGDRDESSARIMAETVHQLASDKDVNLPASMRDSMGHMISMWIDDVNAAAAGRVDPLNQNGLTYGVSDGFLSGQAHAYFRQEEIFEVMREASKDPGAYQEMWDHQRAYTAARLEYEATHAETPVEGIKKVAMNSGNVFGALAEAKGNALGEIAAAHDAQHNAGVERMGALANLVVGEVAGRLPGGQVVGAAGGWYIDTLVENSKVDTMPMTQAEVARLYGNTNANLKELAKDVMYRHEVGQEIPQNSPLRLDDGGLVPRTTMTPEQIEEFNSYVNKNDRLGVVLEEIDQSFPAGQDQGKNSTEPIGGGN